MESKANVVEHCYKNGNQNKKRKLSVQGQSSRGNPILISSMKIAICVVSLDIKQRTAKIELLKGSSRRRSLSDLT